MSSAPSYEDRLRIQTPEGVSLDLTLAGIGSRFLAGALDQLLKWALMLALSAVLASADALTAGALGLGVDEDDSASGFAVAALVVALFLVQFGYDVLFEVLASGRTPGKMAVGLRVVRVSGGPVTFMPSAIRTLLRLVDSLPIFYGVGIAAVALTARNQRLGDLAGATLVIRDRKAETATSTTAPVFRRPNEPAPWQPPAVAAPDWDVSAVTQDEAALVNQYLARREHLDDAPRRALAEDLANRLRPRVAGAPPWLDPDQFLEGVAAAKAARG